MPTSSDFVIVLPGGLPPSHLAGDLAAALRSGQAGPVPTLLAWLSAGDAHVTGVEVKTEGCTPHQYWWLQRSGYEPAAPRVRGAGIAPLLVGEVTDDEPVWLAGLGHIRIAQDHLALADPDAFTVTAAESDALLTAAQPVFQADGYAVQAISPTMWRVKSVGSPPLNVPGATMEAAAEGDVDAWWPQSADARPWRRLVNELQMTWFEHPVNAARRTQGQPEINTLWLFGGAPRWQPALAASHVVGGPAFVAGLARAANLPWSASTEASAANAQAGTIFCVDTLAASARDEDWGRWLSALSDLDRTLFAPIQAALAARRAERVELVLTGHDRIATLTFTPRRGLARWLPAPTKDWTHWWSNSAS